MFKALGAAVIIASSYLFGMTFSLKSKFAFDDMEEIKKALMIYINEGIGFSKPVDSLFADIAKRTNGVISQVFDYASNLALGKSDVKGNDIFIKSIDAYKKDMFFNTDEMELLYMFASNIDCIYSNQQENSARAVIENVQILQKELRERMQRERKLYSSCSDLLGLMICVLLF